MPAFSYDQARNFEQVPGRNKIGISTHHPLNNPSRPEFMSPGGAARAFFRHARRSLLSQSPGVADAYWGELMSTATQAGRNPSQQRQLAKRRASEVEFALSSTEDSLSPEQLQGGMAVALARRDLYASLPETISRTQKHEVISHLTNRALGEVVNDGKDERQPNSAVARVVEAFSQTDDYRALVAGIKRIHENTRAAPISELEHDLDAMEDDERTEVLGVAQETRVRKTSEVIQSFADSFLMDYIDAAETNAKGERSLSQTMFLMETAQEAQVAEKLVNWAHKAARETNGKLPNEDMIKAGLDEVQAELSKPEVTIVEHIRYFSDDEVKKLRDSGRVGDAKMAAQMVYNEKRDVNGGKAWALVTKEAIARKPIFGEKSSQFEFMNGILVDGARYYKNTDAVAEQITTIHASRSEQFLKGSIIIGENPESNVFKTAMDTAKKLGMPIVVVTANYSRESIKDRSTDSTTTVKSLDYTVDFMKKSNGQFEQTTANLFSKEGYSAVNGALVVVRGTASSESQGQLVRWDVLTDMAKQAVIFGYGTNASGRADFNANQLIRKTAEHGKLSAVYDDKGQAVDLRHAYNEAKPSSRTKMEEALSKLDTIDMSAPLSSAYSRLLVEHMHPNRTKEQLGALANVQGTVKDLFDLPGIAAQGAKNLALEERTRLTQIANAVGAQTFATSTLPQVDRVIQAATIATKNLKDIQETGFGVAFDGPGTKNAPLIVGGNGKFDANTPSILIVGNNAEPNAQQRDAIEASVAQAAKKGYTIVTTAEVGSNEAVMAAALKHEARLIVVAPDNPVLKPPANDTLCDRLADVLEAKNGLVVSKYTSEVSDTRSTDRRREAFELASEMASATLLTKAATKDLAAFATAKAGQEKPVAVLPAFGFEDSANRLLTQSFSSLSYKDTRPTTEISPSFYSEMNNAGQWITHREKDSIDVGGRRIERQITWHSGAHAVANEKDLNVFLDQVTREVAPTMIDPTIKTERDLAIRLGLEEAPLDMAQHLQLADEAAPTLEEKLDELLDQEKFRVTRQNSERLSSQSRRLETAGVEL
ncbi:DNA-processing protein DprA [Microvirga tunisiensis]|uniref:Smf/DprA SLOG domain-containing protein n=1 Tax=Microvirga tunisiensis TaxID=2108360 RepID=A0A5N7MIV6_9HYPH|nr:DNA-processing protein DprA [Microvirga tunisiensis]MPR05676.1 hypothetical protein [Microvirga tunisiensis]MPR23876.1 hypothetical protein [Microvirga tunisiensis]